MDALLKLENIVMRFGGLTAVNNFSLSVQSKELIGLIGPNGAGKTTVFDVITGFLIPTAGRVILQDVDVTPLPAQKITARGIARTFQNIRLFPDMTVVENVMVSFHRRLKAQFWQAALGLPSYRREELSIREESMALLEELSLSHLALEKASALPYGQQRRLEIVRALAARPKLLLLDEPAAGMNPQETMELADLVRELRDRYNLSILLVEHDMKFVMNLCERIKVLDHGISLAEGSPSEIQRHPEVIKAYLGDAKHA
jgi:branched-chain amino acid transport system ATP-binding protein